jgi:hypothetical protein
LPVIVSPAVPLTRLGATNALAGVKSGCLEFLLTILTDLCFHGNSVREFSRYCRNARFAVVGHNFRSAPPEGLQNGRFEYADPLQLRQRVAPLKPFTTGADKRNGAESAA